LGKFHPLLQVQVERGARLRRAQARQEVIQDATRLIGLASLPE
jgi:hypothetical protein